uniref:THOC2_N domain-containing protein n=1 Tax=Globodera pallida TaxID=36090 RepID=A0A183BQD4_GLOPA
MHNPSATCSNAHPTSSDDEDKIVQHLLAHCRAFLAKKTSADDCVKHLKAILQAKPANASLLFDVLVALQLEFDEERARKSERADEVHAFLSLVASELLPTDVLTLELNALGADEQQTKSKVVKSKTRMFYKQLKFNLLREESEGYAKLIAELFQSSVVFSGEGTEQLILTVEGLIGQFNLDPNRVVDIVLECFEQSPPNNAPQFIRLIKEFKMDKGDLRNILLLKFLFCQRNEHTPMSLYRVVSHLAQEGLVDIPMLFTLIAPARKELMEEYKSLTDLVKLRSNRAETNELFESLCILIADHTMLNHCQETFVQFFDFLRTNLKPEEYARRMPSASILTSQFHLPIEAALCLTRPIYMHKIEMAYELAKKNGKENNGKAKLDGPQKSSLYKDAFTSTLNALEEELMPVFPEAYWLDMASRMHTIFWLLQMSQGNDRSTNEQRIKLNTSNGSKRFWSLRRTHFSPRHRIFNDITSILAGFSEREAVTKHVTAVRDNEKGKRNDLNLLAASYLVQLTKRNVKVWEPNEFADTRATTNRPK